MRPMKTAPKDGSLILIYLDGGGYQMGYWYSGPKNKWWMSPYQGWVNDGVGWDYLPGTA